jgi:predicted ATP-dependent serine protease
MNFEITGSTTTNNDNISGATIPTPTQSTFLVGRTSTKKSYSKKELVIPTYKAFTLYEFLNTKKDKAFNYKRIFGSLIAEGDLCIFFGKSGTGKSLVGYQLAEAIASGRNFFDMLDDSNIENYDNGEQKYYKLINEAPPQKVLYVDFEMSGEQIAYRYSHKTENDRIVYQHNENLKILKFDSRGFADKTLYIKGIEEYIFKSGIKIVFIDNMSNISMKGEDADSSTNVMNMLKDMQEKYGLTLIILAHTPKIDGLAIKTEDMLKGSSNFANFAESIFCISETTKDNAIRYLKQFKNRFGDKEFGEEKVIEIEFKKKLDGNKGFVFSGYFNENNEISQSNKDKKEALIAEIINMIQRNKGIGTYEVAKRLHINFGNGKKREAFLKQIQRIMITINNENIK